MNEVPLLSTAYWAPVEYFTKVVGRPTVLIEQHENYLKQTYRNRLKIATANGVLQLTIPIIKEHGKKMPVRDVKIDYTEQWQHNHWKAIESAYRSSPFFEYYVDDILPFYEKKEIFLFDLNTKITELSLTLIGIKTELAYTGEFIVPDTENLDFRYTITPKKESAFNAQKYYQVFAGNLGFMPNLSILDLLCNEGPNSLQILQESIA